MIFSQNLLPKITKSWIFSIPGYPSMIPGYWVPGQYPGIRYPGMGSGVSNPQNYISHCLSKISSEAFRILTLG